MKQRIFFAALAAILTLSTGVACAETTLRIGLAEDPDMLDPTLALSYVGRIVFASISDKLFDIDEELSFVPQLALSQETSADGKTATIRLRSGVKFHDGEPFDAEAAKFSLERHLAMTASFRKAELGAVAKVEVADPLTIRLILKNPYSPLIAQLADRAGMMMSPKAAREAGDKFGLHPVCAGPYRFVERVPQDRIVVEKFQDYWNRDNVHIDRIIYVPIADSMVRLANVKSGGLDLIERLAATDIAAVRGDPTLTLAGAIGLGYQGITMNVGNGERADTPFGKDARVRKAFELAIDRDAINQVVFNGQFMPGNQWINPENPYYQKSLPVPGRDIARAQDLLKEAGVSLPVPVDLIVQKGQEQQQVAEVIQAMTAEAGFAVTIRVTEFTTALNEAAAGRYQAFLVQWSGRVDPDGNCYAYYKCKAAQNVGGYCDGQVDGWLEAARAVNQPEERKAIYEKMAKKVLGDISILYLYHARTLIVHTARLEGYRAIPDGLVRVVGLRLK